ncbi:MAG: ribosomal protein S18-alanine N-acetyltransferase [Acidobacteriota bacterium]|nr:ribosomal protein S18-alanine N-acetyltransferase [Acidobacteriota bacterium]
MTIRPLDPADAEAVERITRLSPEAADWPMESYRGLPAWVAESDGRVLGLLVARIAADEMEILNLAVEPASRRRGAGTALVDAAVEHGRRTGAARVFLEVRESNLVAQRFYERRGFAVTGRRLRYYRQPEEDALLMAREVAPAP